MITMIDEIFDRNYQAGRKDMNAALLALISRGGRSIINAFNVLNRIEYSAPWAKRPKSASFR
jgi:hypothetical protein